MGYSSIRIFCPLLSSADEVHLLPSNVEQRFIIGASVFYLVGGSVELE
jgi:hypothetical protein